MIIYLWILVTLVCCSNQTNGWGSPATRGLRMSIQSTSSSGTSKIWKPLSAASAVIKRGKKKYIDELYQEIKDKGNDHYIVKFLKTGERPPLIERPISFYAMMRFLGVFIVMPEFNRKVKTNFIFGLPPPEIMSGVYRDAGARAIIAAMDPRTGGVSVEEFMQLTIDQAKSKTFLPGSLPVVWHDVLVDKIQVHQAAALGASAITIQEELLRENTTEILQLCRRYKLEPIFLIKSVEDFTAGLQQGVRCFMAHQLGEEELRDLRKQLPSKKERPDLFIGARLRPAAEYSLYYEIDLSWGVRGFGYDGVWPSPDGLYSQEMSDVYSGIIAMKAKASRRFLTPRAFLAERKKEGVTEYLGDILY